jgi:hypothetical protein
MAEGMLDIPVIGAIAKFAVFWFTMSSIVLAATVVAFVVPSIRAEFWKPIYQMDLTVGLMWTFVLVFGWPFGFWFIFQAVKDAIAKSREDPPQEYNFEVVEPARLRATSKSTFVVEKPAVIIPFPVERRR